MKREINIDVGVLLTMIGIAASLTGISTYFITRKKEAIRYGLEEGAFKKDVEYIRESVDNIEVQFKNSIDRIEKQFDKSIVLMEKRFETYDISGIKTAVELLKNDVDYLKSEIAGLRTYKHETNNELNKILSLLISDKK